MHNGFIEEINKAALSANDDKRIQSIDSIENYEYRTSKDSICEKENIKCKIWLTLMMLQKKTGKTIIQMGRKFLITHTENWRFWIWKIKLII